MQGPTCDAVPNVMQKSVTGSRHYEGVAHCVYSRGHHTPTNGAPQLPTTQQQRTGGHRHVKFARRAKGDVLCCYAVLLRTAVSFGQNVQAQQVRPHARQRSLFHTPSTREKNSQAG